MPPIKTWLVDFDETLASSSITWAFREAIPKFVREHQLTFDENTFASVALTMQERSSQSNDIDALLRDFFELMGWPLGAQHQLLDDLLSNYRPTLFDDTVEFLERLKSANQRVFIVSNNNRTPEHAELLRISGYADGVFTPNLVPGAKPKPHPSMWEHIASTVENIDPRSAIVIGDDPWSDGKFAEACNLPCWIVDRMNRFTAMRGQTPYFWVSTLADIPI
jgi:FMN phosphatase YigB (HAD superfamily)